MIEFAMILAAMYLLWWSGTIYINVMFKSVTENETPRAEFITSCILPFISTLLIYHAVV